MLHSFLRDETISGKLIVVAALLSLVIVNSPLLSAYDSLWHTKLSIGLGDISIAMDLRHWVTEALMAFFFLVVGLEIKRELVRGELSNIKAAALPIGAALGGMVVPALIYFAFNPSGELSRGWGIPIATDIAFAVGILSLLGPRIPLTLKIFLLTLAIADDIGAIIVIALFYAEIIHTGFLFASIILFLAMWLWRKQFDARLWLLLFAGLTLWVTTHLSGIHASVVGAALGLLAPMTSRGVIPPISEKLERAFLPFSTFVVLPVFVFANAGFVFSWDALTDPASASLRWGIVLGLVVGKVAGITLSAWLLVKLGIATLPASISWRQISGVGLLAGIGFTVSIFITELAFADNRALVDAAKVSILIASVLSASLGAAVLMLKSRRSVVK